MTGNLDMNNKQINNLPLPTGNNQPTTLVFTNRAYLLLDGTAPMGGNLNMNNKSIKHLRPPVFARTKPNTIFNIFLIYF